jgi:hypothetical protein
MIFLSVVCGVEVFLRVFTADWAGPEVLTGYIDDWAGPEVLTSKCSYLAGT